MAGFEAFEPSVVVDEFARKIEALCVWGNTLLVGLSDGSLLFFEQQSGGNAVGASISTWQVTKVQKNFGKRGTAQLQALQDQPYLLSLSDEGVQLHSLPELQLVSAASRTGRAAAFSWDEGRQLLATAIKKKVITHQLDSSHTFTEMTEYAIPEAVAAISWVGSNILLGTAKNYWLIIPAPSQSVEVLPGQVMTIYPAVQPHLLFAAGSQQPPVIRGLSAGEVLITKDAVSYFLGPDGKPSRKTTLTWSQAPVALLATKMYVAALLPAAVEVKSISKIGAAAAEQMLLLPNMAIAAPTPAQDGSLYIASATDGGIRQLTPVPLERQAKLLAAAGDFQGALELLTLLEDEHTDAKLLQGVSSDKKGVPPVAARRQQLEDVLRLKFGYHLFAAGEPDEALTQFSMCSDPDPLLLLTLYPTLVPDKFKPLLPTSAYGEPLPDLPEAATAAAGNGPEGNFSSSKAGSGKSTAVAAAHVGVVVPYLLSHRTRLMASLQDAAAADGAAAAAAAALSSSRASSEACGTADTGVLNSIGNAGCSIGVSAANANGPKAARTSSETGSSSSSTAAAEPRSYQELQLIATVIDTAILRAMLLQPDSGALLRLLQQVNYVDLEDGEAVLSAAGRYAELAALYQYNKQHNKGLQLLRQLSQCPSELEVPACGAAVDLKGFPGVWAAVRYLVALEPQDLQLLLDHAGWVLEADPEAGLEALLAINPPLKPDTVMPLLEAHAPAYKAVYLESALDLGLVAPREVHSELLLIYLHMALEEERDGESSAEQHARQLSLSDLLVSRPPQPLKLFPDDPNQWKTTAPRSSAGTVPTLKAATAAAAKHGILSAVKSKLWHKQPPSSAATEAADESGGDSAMNDADKQSVSSDHSSSSQTNGAQQLPRSTVSTTYTNTLPSPGHPKRRRDAYQRLRDLVYASPYIDPEYVLSKLGQSQLLEIRALMLERLGRHREALSVYVHDLKAIKLAEEYCDRVYEAGIAAAAAAARTGQAAAAAAAAHHHTGSGGGGLGAAAAVTHTDAPAQPSTGGQQHGGWGAVKQIGPGWGTSAQSDSSSKYSSATKGWQQQQQKKEQQQGLQQRVRGKPGLAGDHQQQQQQQPGKAASGHARGWPSLPFGVRPQDIYMELVDAVLQGPNKQMSAAQGSQQQQQQQAVRVDSASWQQLAQLLSRKTDRINHLQVLGVLPKELPISEVACLLSSMLLYNTEQRRNLAIVHHLRRAENLMAREELVKVKQKVVILTFDRACCICHKRIGGAVSVAYPNGSLAHYLCFKRSTGDQQPTTTGNNISHWGQTSNLAGSSGPVASQGQHQQQSVDPDGWGGMLAAMGH